LRIRILPAHVALELGAITKGEGRGVRDARRERVVRPVVRHAGVYRLGRAGRRLAGLAHRLAPRCCSAGAGFDAAEDAAARVPVTFGSSARNAATSLAIASTAPSSGRL